MKSMIILSAVSLMLCSSLVYAAPRALSGADLDKVTAGASIADAFLGAMADAVSPQTSTPAEITTTQNPSTTSGAGSPAVAGDNNTTAGAVADNGAYALNGEDNIAVDLTQNGGIAVGGSVAGDHNNPNIQNGDGANIMLGDVKFCDSFKAYTNIYTSTNIGAGNASLIGDNGKINNNTDNSEVEGSIGVAPEVPCGTTPAQDGENTGGSGVVARTATISDAFKTTVTTNVVTTVITDSFNTVTNTLDVSGQCAVSGIITANSLCFQNIGSNMNITTASSTTPSNTPSPDSLNVLAGLGAAALANVAQTNVSGSIGVFVGEVEVETGLLTGAPIASVQ